MLLGIRSVRIETHIIFWAILNIVLDYLRESFLV